MSDATSLPNFPPPADEHPLRGRVLDSLADAGMAPNLDEDGDVAIVISEQKLFVRCVDGDVPMMRVFGQWRIGDAVAADELTRLRAASHVTATVNLVKLSVHNGVLVVAADAIVTEGSSLDVLLGTSINLVLSAVKVWHVQAGGAVEEDPDDEPGSPGGGSADGL
jgi:hypothetical protein